MYHRTLQAQKMSHRGRSHHQARNAPSAAEKRLHRHQPFRFFRSGPRVNLRTVNVCVNVCVISRRGKTPASCERNKAHSYGVKS
jgi:hypothetical protein